MKTETKTTAPTFKMIPLSDIAIGKTNPRKDFDQETSQELIDSVREKGVLQPVIVRASGKGYELVCGERRYRAAKAVQVAIKDRTTIPAMIRELSDDEVIELQIIENLQRKDVHPMEEASAFKQLMDSKKFNIEEIAKRVGKSGNYVAQRLKLNDIIPEYQKAFYQNKLSLISMTKLFKISKEDQKDMFKEQMHGNGGKIQIDDSDIKEYSGNLNDAPFDTNDPGLDKKMGACGSCQNNTASNTLLFPEGAAGATCLLKSCFKNKAAIAYDNELKKAKEDPSVALISLSYEAGKEAKELIKKGLKVIVNGYNSSVEQMEKPDMPERKDYEENLDDGDYDSPEEMEKEYSNALRDYQEELESYEKAISSGKYIKAFVVEGNDKGKFAYVKLKKAAAVSSGNKSESGTKEKKKEDIKMTDADVKAEIERINENSKRKHEIESEKLQISAYETIEKSKTFVACHELTKIEKVGFIMSVLQRTHNSFESSAKKAMGFKGGSDYREMGMYKFLIAATPKDLDKYINAAARAIMAQEMKCQNGNRRETHGFSELCCQIMIAEHPEKFTELENERKKTLSAYDEKVKSKITALKAQLKPAKKK